jgi:transposase InsO family protein
VKYAWILANRELYSIPMMCELLAVSRSGLHAAAQRESSERRLDEVEVVEQIRRAQIKHRGRYGRRRMTPEVSEALGRKINHKRIGRLMREHGLQSRKRRAFRVRTTDSKHAYPIAPNILERDFACPSGERA